MKFTQALAHAVLYVALAVGVNTAVAGTADLEALRTGDMRKLGFHAEPRPMAETSFVDIEDVVFDLSAFEGKIVLLNFWATWCAPCRKEMPALDALQQTLGGDDFEVVTMATGRNPLPAVNKFFDEVNIKALTVYRDPKQLLAREMAVLGLPVTVILDRQGREIARLTGDADWHGEDALALLRAVISDNPVENAQN